MADRKESKYVIMFEFKLHCIISKNNLLDEIRRVVFQDQTLVANSTLEAAMRSSIIDISIKENREVAKGAISITLNAEPSTAALLASAIQNIEEVNDCKAKFDLIYIGPNRVQKIQDIRSVNQLKKNLLPRFRNIVTNLHLLKKQFDSNRANNLKSPIPKSQSISLSDYPIIMSLTLLFASSFVLMQGDSGYANSIVMIAFVLIIAGVTWKVFELYREKLQPKRSVDANRI